MDVLDWAAQAAVGDSVTYTKRTGNEYSDPIGLQTAYAAHEKGLVFLQQRRVQGYNGAFEYEAIRISRETAKLLGVLPWKNYRKGEAR